MEVTAFYNNGTSEVVEGYTTDPQDGTEITEGLTQIVVSYTEGGITKTATLRLGAGTGEEDDPVYHQ